MWVPAALTVSIVRALIHENPGKAGFEGLLMLPAESASMELDRETRRQILLSAGAVALFILAALAVSMVFGSHAIDTGVNGTIDGNLSGEPVDGTVNATFEGRLSNAVEGNLTGTIEGSLDGDRLTGTFNGTINGSIVVGDADGMVNATYNASSNHVSGAFDGRVNGTNAGTTISDTGGIALVGVLAVFIFLMAAAGVWLERQDFDDS